MRWVDLFVIDTFLASGQRALEVEPVEDEPPLADGTERTERFDDLDEDGDEWDAETLDEIPEDLEIPAAGDDALCRGERRA